MNREIETNRKGKHHRNMSERYELDQRAIVNELSVTPSIKALELQHQSFSTLLKVKQSMMNQESEKQLVRQFMRTEYFTVCETAAKFSD